MLTTYYGKVSSNYLIEKKLQNRKKDQLNYTHLVDPTLEEIQREVSSKPLFNSLRTTVIEGLKNIKNEESLISILQNKRDNNHVIFIVPSYGKQFQKLKTHLSKGQVIKVKNLTEKEAIKYAIEESRKVNPRRIPLDKGIAEFLIFMIGVSPEDIYTTLTEVYKQKREITIHLVNELVTRKTNQKVLDITNTFYNPEKLQQTLTFLYSLIAEDSKNLSFIFNFLSSDLRVAIVIKEKTKKGKLTHEIPYNPYRVRIIKNRIKDIPLEKLLYMYIAINDCIYMDIHKGSNPLPRFINKYFKFIQN